MTISPEITPVSNQILIFGRGIDEYGGLTESSMQRAEHAARYYHNHPNVFNEPGSVIVCSGGWPAMETDDFPHREGDKMADILLTAGVPRNRIKTENASRTTLQNLTNVLELGYLSLDSLTEERPLGAVGHAGHLDQIVLIGRKVLGSETPIARLVVPGEDSPERAREARMSHALWRVAFAGVREGNTKALLRREALVVGAARGIKRVRAQLEAGKFSNEAA